MALLLVCLAAFLLAAASVHAAGQDGFLSIDCGLDAALSGREDTVTEITYVSDGPYVDGGENHKIADDHVSSVGSDASRRTLRNFRSGLRNCYTLPTESGAKYLVRMVFFHGKYDGTSTPMSVKFDLHLGTDHWDTVTIQSTVDNFYSEAVFVAWASWVPVCLVNTGTGTPFVSTVELRPMGAALYLDVNAHQSMSNYASINLGANTLTRFPDDPYDRYWSWLSPSSSWANLSTQNAIAQQDQDSFTVPSRVLQTTISAAGNDTLLNVLIQAAHMPVQPLNVSKDDAPTGVTTKTRIPHHPSPMRATMPKGATSMVSSARSEVSPGRNGARDAPTFASNE